MVFFPVSLCLIHFHSCLRTSSSLLLCCIKNNNNSHERIWCSTNVHVLREVHKAHLKTFIDFFSHMFSVIVLMPFNFTQAPKTNSSPKALRIDFSHDALSLHRQSRCYPQHYAHICHDLKLSNKKHSTVVMLSLCVRTHLVQSLG